MDWIEQFLGISPDGGSGLTEIAFVTTLVLLVAAVTIVVVRRSRSR